MPRRDSTPHPPAGGPRPRGRPPHLLHPYEIRVRRSEERLDLDELARAFARLILDARKATDPNGTPQ
jgi:hypothetical protein